MSRLGAVKGLSILGTGKALPAWRVDNAEVLARALALAARCEAVAAGDRGPGAGIAVATGTGEARAEKGVATRLSPAGLRKLSGVSTRYWTHAIGDLPDHAEPNALDLAVGATREAIADAGLRPEDVGGILLATTSAPRPSVNTAGHVAKALGLGGFALELKAGCASAIHGLAVAASLYHLGATNLVLVASEAWTKLTPAGLPGPMAVAGDGAAAVVLGSGTGEFLGGALLAESRHAGAMMPPGLYPPTPEALAAGDYEIRITEDVAERVRAWYPRILSEALAAAGVAHREVDLFIPHQASGPIVRRALRDCGIPATRAYHTLERYGNASSASVLLSLHDARTEGRLKRGDTVVLFAVGGGISAAGAVLRI